MGARSPAAVLRPVYPYKFDVSASVTAPSDLKRQESWDQQRGGLG